MVRRQRLDLICINPVRCQSPYITLQLAMPGMGLHAYCGRQHGSVFVFSTPAHVCAYCHVHPPSPWPASEIHDLGHDRVDDERLPTYLYVSDSLRSIAAARHESVGAVPALVVNKVVQLMQVHRGLSAGMLGGDEALAARRPAARDALEKAMAEVATSFAAAQVPAAQTSAWAQAQQT